MFQVIAWAVWALVTWRIFGHDHDGAYVSAVIGILVFYAINVRHFALVRAGKRRI